MHINPLESTLSEPGQGGSLADVPSDIYLPNNPEKVANDFLLIEPLLGGAMGEVWLAWQLSARRHVVIKFLFQLEGGGRFQQEIHALSKLRHPNIVCLFQTGFHLGRAFFVMEYVPGQDWARRLSRQRPTPREAAALVETIARAMEYAHENGILHRDLKPSNILIDPNGGAKVTDFGLAKDLNSSIQRTTAGERMGTPSYMAPEQVQPQLAPISVATDIYGLGATFYEALVGRPPFSGSVRENIYSQILTQDPVPPRHLSPKIPKALETICLKALTKRPRDRYSSMSEFADDLGRWSRNKPILARPVSTMERIWLLIRRYPLVSGLVMAVAFILVTALIVVNNGRVRLSASNSHLMDTVGQLRLVKADADFEGDKVAEGLRLAALELRENPADWNAMHRLVTALDEHPFLWPIADVELPFSHQELMNWSDDGRFVATVGISQDKKSVEICLVDIAKGLCLGSQLVPAPAGNFQFSKDSIWLMISTSSQIVVFDTRDFSKPGTVLRQSSEVLAAQFAGDGNVLVTLEKTPLASRWDSLTGNQLPPTPIPGVAISIDFDQSNGAGRLLLQNGEVWECDPRVQLVARKMGDFGPTTDAVFASPHNDRLIVHRMTTNANSSMSLYAESNHRLLFKTNAIDAAFSRDGQKAILRSTMDPGGCVLLDTSNGQSFTSVWNNLFVTPSHCFSPDAMAIVASPSRTARSVMLYSVPHGNPLSLPVYLRSFIYDSGFSPQGDRIAAVDKGKTISIWDSRPSSSHTFDLPGTYANRFLFSSDGNQFYAVSNNSVAVWNTRTWQRQSEALQLASPISVLVRASKADVLVIVAGDQVTILESVTGTRRCEIHFSATVARVAVSDNGNLAAVATHDDQVHILDVSAGREILPPISLKSRQTADWGWMGSVKLFDAHFSPDNKLLAMALYNGETLVYKLSDPQTPLAFVSEAPVARVRFSPNGRLLAVGGMDHQVKIHSLMISREPSRVLFYQDTISSMEYSADGKQLLVSTLDGNSSVWDPNQAMLIFETGHSGQDGSYNSTYVNGHRSFYVAGSKSGVRLFDSRNGLPLMGHRYPGNGSAMVAASPDGKWLAIYRTGDRISIMELPQLPDRAPEWLPRLAEAVAGPPFPRLSTHDGAAPITRMLRLRDELTRRAPTEPLAAYLAPQ